MKNHIILYIGGVHQEGSSYSRYKALTKNYGEVLLLNTSSTHSVYGRIKTKLRKIIGNYLDKEILKILDLHKPDIIWFDKPTTISYKAMCEVVKRHSDKFFVAHVTDDIRTMITYAPKIVEILCMFDVVFTPNQFNINEYRQINLKYNELGYDPEMYLPVTEKKQKKSTNLSFIGHYETRYEEELIHISELIEKSDFQLKIYGTGWWRSNQLKKRENVEIRTGWKTLQDLKIIYADSLAGIGLYSTANRNMTSGRVFEIPALKVPLITRDNNIIKHYLGGHYINLNECDTSEKFLLKLRNNTYLRCIADEAEKHMQKTRCTWQDRIDECVLQMRNMLDHKVGEASSK
jgi:hypothetical protein